ncbi:zinc-dependent peptidase [Paucibacter sp. Y2R2-4]|uniref:M90 family metallopeptidase n=1 Tax=Paucibacter sp. Y2R2-4 TaxID=2893553 RepID=UPI0021E41FAC|nr:M90 family metallopeptidase [Paucibacter sp. Y2R2-4]MCV2348865.1 zinc-dependent peptidase [Paucibacter sp. Y2R2-4]
MWHWLRESWRRRREAQALRRHAIPEALWQLTLLRYPFLARRSPTELQELRRLCSLFLAEKEFHGAAGFVVTDEVAVAVAAQACLPVLRLGLDWYSGFVGIVMHADEVLAQREVVDDDGIVHHYEEALAGEAMEGGPLMLTWASIKDEGDIASMDPHEAGVFNVVIHEFAHIIDMRDGFADGVPPMPSSAAREQWLQVLDTEWQAFCEQVEQDLPSPIDAYGSESPEEFFAVASEAFFVAPEALWAAHPGVYQLLSGFFQQDPRP